MQIDSWPATAAVLRGLASLAGPFGFARGRLGEGARPHMGFLAYPRLRNSADTVVASDSSVISEMVPSEMTQ